MTALITGGSTGIGFAIARELAGKGYDLLLIARSEAELQKACESISNEFPVRAEAFVADLSEDDAPEKIRQHVSANNLSLSILVNNAGYAVWGSFEELSIEEQEKMLRVNVLNLLRLTHVMLPVLHQQEKAFILNVSSTTAYQAIPNLNVYAASKTFVLQFSRALKLELLRSTISVSCLVPGTTTSNFMDRAGMTTEKMRKQAAKFTMEPSTVARIAIDGMFKGNAEIVPGFTNWFSAKMTSFLPKALPEKIAAAIYRKD